jgi:hypothetical protein
MFRRFKRQDRQRARPAPMITTVFAILSILLGGLLMTSCSPAPAPVSQSMQDPSNPAAPEGTTRTVAPPPSAAPPSSSADPHMHHHDHGSKK